MGKLVRFGVSMDEKLVQELDQLVITRNYGTRSEALRDLVRKELHSEIVTDEAAEVIAIVQLIFPVHRKIVRNPIDAYPSLQIITNLQQHLQSDICMKILIVSGRNDEVQAWSGELLQQREVIGNLTITTSEAMFAELLGPENPSS